MDNIRTKKRGIPASTMLPARPFLTFLGLLFFLFLYNEFLVYYVVLLQCSWPKFDSSMADLGVGSHHKGELKAMFLADTHLLGVRQGHWFDKLRREWQMERSFQTALTIFNPDIIFILGDLFDEGKWASNAEFQDYVQRFERMFRHSESTDRQVVVGNHDIGFHYMVDKNKRQRFSRIFEAPSVKLHHKHGSHFVMLNSMAFEGDHCSMCAEAERELRMVQDDLNCAKVNYKTATCRDKEKFSYSRPILLQHFPMYRESDANCTGPDSAPPDEKYVPFKQKFDCLSKEASQTLFQSLHPRLIITGHTHHFCLRRHGDGTEEWTVPSFSWRNKPNPSFLLVTTSPQHHAVSKCSLPVESTVVNTYIVGSVVIVLWLLTTLYLRRKNTAYHSSSKIS